MILEKLRARRRKRKPKGEGLHPPWSVQIELTEGCNRLCSFCGLTALRTAPGKPWHFMEIQLAEKLAKQLSAFCPNARIEFAMHGEPTLNPDWIEIVGIFRRYLPTTQFQLTTNGRTWMRGKSQGNSIEKNAIKAFEAGIDVIVLDTYDPEREKLQALAKACTRFKVLDYYDDCQPQGISPWANHKRGMSGTLIIMDDIGIRNGESKARTLMNHAGNAKSEPIPDEPFKRTCTLPFRELAVCFNGNVTICCMDWGHEYTCGNVNDTHIYDIWWGAEFQAARKLLQSKERGFSPCDRCNAKSGTRAGLLPKMPKPDSETLSVVRKVHSKPQRNELTKRIWDSMIQLCEGNDGS